jgi:hypothetical protein
MKRRTGDVPKSEPVPRAPIRLELGTRDEDRRRRASGVPDPEPPGPDTRRAKVSSRPRPVRCGGGSGSPAGVPGRLPDVCASPVADAGRGLSPSACCEPLVRLTREKRRRSCAAGDLRTTAQAKPGRRRSSASGVNKRAHEGNPSICVDQAGRSAWARREAGSHCARVQVHAPAWRPRATPYLNACGRASAAGYTEIPDE